MVGYGNRTFRDFLISSFVRVDCRKCGRAGRYRLETLVAKYGWDKPLFEWGNELTADCPQRGHYDFARRCHGPGFPDLIEITGIEEWRKKGRPRY